MTNEFKYISQLVADAVAVGCAKALQEIIPKNDDLSISKAEKLFGVKRIRDLLYYDRIHPYAIGSRKYLSRSEISQVICESSAQLLLINMFDKKHSSELVNAKPRQNAGCMLQSRKKNSQHGK